jgi:3-oxoadipyl-CoA thiolase
MGKEAAVARDAVVVAAARTPFGRYGGVLKSVRPDDLAAIVIKEVIRRAGVDGSQIEDVLLGCANQSGEDNRNVARMSALLAGLPVEVAGQTINRLCGSGLQAVVSAAHAIACDAGDMFVAGGVESMTRAPFVLGKAEEPFQRANMSLQDTTLGWRFINPRLQAMCPPFSMGETAENVASRYGITRDDQDAFALQSQKRACAAMESGRLADEIVGVEVPQRKGESVVVTKDEHPRPETTLESLKKLKPAFKEGGSVTAGNSSGINDGAAALLVVSRERAQELGLTPLARIVSAAVAGVDPAYMGLGPVPSSRKALERARLSVADMDLFEVNEAFASQSLQCARELGIDPERLNVNGGAIALGHPLGASGARILMTLIYELRRRKKRYGLAAMCIGVGQGIAAVVETL